MSADKKRGCGCGGAALFVILLFIGIGMAMSLADKRGPSPSPAPAPEPAIAWLTAEGTTERICEQIARETLAGDLRSVSAPGSGLFIEYEAGENLTSRLTGRQIVSSARKFSERLFADSGASGVEFYEIEAVFPMQDKYGNRRLGVVGKFILFRSTAARIVWANIHNEQFLRICRDEHTGYLHPEFEQER